MAGNLYCEFSREPSKQDNGFHQPTTDDKWWQESTVFTWGDPRRGFGGELRFGMHPNQGVSNLYAWIVWDGRLIYRRHLVDQPLPKEVLNCEIAGASVRTIEPLMQYELALKDANIALKLNWRNFHTPLAMSYNVGGATVTAGHYNIMGECAGEVSVDGVTFPVGGAGFHDHSWGVRRKHLPASRSYFCVFNSDFYLMAIPVLSEAGERRMIGYVRHGGKVGRLGVDSKLGYAVQDDWITVASCDSLFWDEHERGFRIKGRTIGEASTQAMGHGKLVHHAVAEFECGGLIGKGILETSFPKRMRPDQIAELGLDPDSWWLNEGRD